VEAVRAAVDAFNEGNIDGYLDYIDPSCERWIKGLDQPLTFAEVGDGLRQMHLAFEGLRLDAQVLFGEDRFVCARWRMRGTQVREFLGLEASGQPIDVETCEVYEVTDDRVTTTWVYGDVAELIRQLTGDGDSA
jgi:predicted ester cyclase